MNAETLQNGSALNIIQPESRSISFIRQGATEPETVVVYAMPLQKWKKGMLYIAQIAPMLGFDLSAAAEQAQAQIAADGEVTESPAEESPADVIDTKRLFAALQGEGSDLILEFTAFAIDKEVDFFNGMYDEVIDILAAVIELNLAFFVQRLLPKIAVNTNRVVATVNGIRKALPA